MADRPEGNENVKEIKSSIAKKYDAGMESAVLTWIAGVLGDTGLFAGVRGSDAVREKLKDGVILCDLMNKIKPGSIKKINKSKMPFLQMENIGFFNNAMREYRVEPSYLFVTTDLYEGQNMVQVLIGLRALGTMATKNGIKPAITI
ncbi:calponin-1-like [Hydractinia symbiolongicarpus]|uniref:calponin-1-like n=1 Tax=Hydractinia symbiolongicarpus TaxID=13093 RepID=UPI002551531C|nr:calponin-1-like [Hydractinia symbiolongicarpus]